jgi:RNA polymerase sigma-70 factor (ECF subfamily)
MTGPPTDDELLAAARRAPETFGAVFDRYHAVIHRYAAHRLDRASADDIAAEAFIRALAAVDRAYTVDGALRAWLFAIAGNLIRDEHRRRSRARDADARLRGGAAPHAVDPSDQAPDPELLRAVRSLRDEEQEVLVLFAWGDLSYDEIAATTGVAVGTVRSRLHRARVQLRATLSATTTEQLR